MRDVISCWRGAQDYNDDDDTDIVMSDTDRQVSAPRTTAAIADSADQSAPCQSDAAAPSPV